MGSSATLDDGIAADAQALAALGAGQLVDARRAVARAIELLICARGRFDPDTANVLLHASRIERVAGDLHAARAHADDAVTASRTWRGDDAAVVGLRFDAEIELATLDQALGDLDAAERRLVDALTAARRTPFGERAVTLLTNALGVTFKFAGRLEDAQRCYDAVHGFIRTSPVPEPTDLATLWHNFAGLAHARGDIAGGLLWAQRGIDIRSALGHVAVVDLARDYAGLGALQHVAGDLTRAHASYVRAERQLTAALGPDHHEVAVVLVNRAALECDTGNAAGARRLYRRALTSLSAAFGPDHYEVQFVEANLRLLL